MELLQIATAYFIAKCDGLLLQIATAFLLQSATRFITNCDRYYKVRWLLQIATVQALFSFRFENYIPAGMAKRNNFSGSR